MDTYEATVENSDGTRSSHWYQAEDYNGAFGIAQIKAGHQGYVLNVTRVRTITYTR